MYLGTETKPQSINEDAEIRQNTFVLVQRVGHHIGQLFSFSHYFLENTYF